MIGRIIGRNATEIIFRYKYKEDIKIGEILVAEDEEKDKKFFLRVIDLRYGMEGPEAWGLRAAGDMILMDEMEEAFTMREKERRLFKLGVCIPLGYLSNGRFHKPKAIPSHFAKVRRAEEEDYSFLGRYLGEIEIGRLRSGENVVNVPVGIKKDLLSHHIGIFATTGMGKSNLMRVFASSVLQRGGCGLLIIDPHGEYYEGGAGMKGLKHHPKANDSLVMYSPHPISGPYNTLCISAQEITVRDIQNVFSFTEAQEDALYALSSKFGKKWLVELCERSIDDLVAAFERKIQDITFNVLKRRLERIFHSRIIHTKEDISIIDSIIQHLRDEKVVIVDTSGLSEYEELLVGVVLARKILEYAKFLYQKENFQKFSPFLIVMEEAQRVLQQKENIFSQIAREGRKFKVGLCAITQQPKLIKEEILSQFNTFCILGLADEGDRSILKSSSKQDLSRLEKEIQTLEVGEALITYPGAPFAIPVKIHWYDDYLKSHQEQSNGMNDKMEIDEGFY
ncbi:MAG: ATP-binding protein [Thermoplasmata archaeon]|nr:MAG: ATP-binding protein [Thermoplasmata archaeon]